MKKGDWLLIAALAAISFVPLCLLPGSSGAVAARLKVDGTAICEIAGGTYRWEEGEEYLEFCFEDGRAWVIASSCPDQLCVKSGQAQGAGQALICLPNRAVIELVGQNAADAVV